MNILTMTEADPQTLRAKIEQLCIRHAQGDLPERPFQHALARCSADLGRAVVQERMAEGETILHEHHVFHALLQLTESLFKEPDREVISLYATDRRLLRLGSTLGPGQSPSCDEKDKTVVDEVPFDRIVGLQVHRQIRLGEILVGLAIAGIGLLFHSWLSVTGPFMIGLGILGALHGVLLPTCWVEVKTRPSSPIPIIIHATRKKSGRRVLRLLSQKVPQGSPPSLAAP